MQTRAVEVKRVKIIVRCILLLVQQNDNFRVEEELFGPSADRLKPNFW